MPPPPPDLQLPPLHPRTVLWAVVIGLAILVLFLAVALARPVPDTHHVPVTDEDSIST